MLNKGKAIFAVVIVLLASTMIFGVVTKRKIPLNGAETLLPYADSEVLVKFKAGIDLAAVKKFAAEKGLKLKKHFGLLSEIKGRHHWCPGQ